MPSIVKAYDPKRGPLINTYILPRGTSDWGTSPHSPPPRNPYEFLLDTGANRTHIAPRLAEEIGLEPQGYKNMITTGGKVPTTFYIVNLGLIFDGGAEHWEQNHEVLAFRGNEQGYDGLIGRDIICRGMLHISKDRYYTFSL